MIRVAVLKASIGLTAIGLVSCAHATTPEAAPASSSSTEAQAPANSGDRRPDESERAAETMLASLLAGGVLESPTFSFSQRALGLERTCEVVRPAYRRTFDELRPGWLSLYAGILRSDPRMTPLDLDSGSTPGERRTFFALGLEGSEMITERIAEIELVLSEAVGAIDTSSIDYELREREMAEARAANRHHCGLVALALESR